MAQRTPPPYGPVSVTLDLAAKLIRALAHPRLGSPIQPRSEFRFVEQLEIACAEVAEESLVLLSRLGGACDVRDLSSMPVDVDGAWRVVPLVDRWGVAPYLADMPATSTILGGVPRLRCADLLQLDGDSTIKVHHGFNPGVLRAHLTLVEPEGTEPCQLEFPEANVLAVWRYGQAFVFDDLAAHLARNERETPRLVLHLEFDRPCQPGLDWVNRVYQRFYRRHAVHGESARRAADLYRVKIES